MAKMNAPEILNTETARIILEETTVKVDFDEVKDLPQKNLLIRVTAKNGGAIWYNYQRQLLEIFNYEIARAKIENYEIRLYNPFAK